MSKALTVSCTISTKDRFHTTLPMAVASVLTQTRLPDELIVFNDGEDKDPRNDVVYEQVCKMMDHKGLKWVFAHGRKLGQAHNHEMALRGCTNDLIWRLDDDNIAESDTLEKLLIPFEHDQVGAVGGIVVHPGVYAPLPRFITGKIEDIDCDQNIQWFKQSPELKTVDHLYSTFVYRRSAGIQSGGYPLNLSPVSHREETIFSHRIKRAGFDVLVQPAAMTWHLRSPHGGIRSFTDHSMWDHDDQIFRQMLKEWGIKTTTPKLIVLEGGLGDHYAFKKVFPEIRAKHLDKKFIIACVFPESIIDIPGVHLISIEEMKCCFGPDPIAQLNVYKWMEDRNWRKHICEAYRHLYA
jgi:GT2 family glycosyltransferase